MEKILLSTCISIALLTGCGGGGASDGSVTPVAITAVAPAPVQSAPACHVVIYGDSIIANSYETETMPASILRQRPTWTVDNRAVPGQTALAGATTYMSDSRPRGVVVVVEWGMNDLIQAEDQFLVPLTAFVKELQAEGDTVVLTGISAQTIWPNEDHYNGELLQLAVDSGSAFASWGEVAVTTVDGVHPNAASSEVLVENLLNTLDKECTNG